MSKIGCVVRFGLGGYSSSCNVAALTLTSYCKTKSSTTIAKRSSARSGTRVPKVLPQTAEAVGVTTVPADPLDGAIDVTPAPVPVLLPSTAILVVGVPLHVPPSVSPCSLVIMARGMFGFPLPIFDAVSAAMAAAVYGRIGGDAAAAPRDGAVRRSVDACAASLRNAWVFVGPCPCCAGWAGAGWSLASAQQDELEAPPLA